MRSNRSLALLAGITLLASCTTLSADPAASGQTIVNHGNPLFRDRYTADPAPLVVGDTLYLYVGHDEARGEQMFNITEWLAYSTKDMQTWTFHGPIMKPTDFSWVEKDAWASQVHEKDGKFWFYTAVEHDPAGSHGKSIGVAVAESPLGPFRDAKGRALVRNEDTQGPHHWDDIDPTVWTEEDGTSWLIWGNGNCYMARLKPNMIEFDGSIRQIELKKAPSVSETLDWARTLLLLGVQQIDAETARSTINILLKYQSDIVKALRELEDAKSDMAKDTAATSS